MKVSRNIVFYPEPLSTYHRPVLSTVINNSEKGISAFHTLTRYRPAMPFGNRKFILEDLFSSVLSQFKKHHPSGNLKFIHSCIFQSLKFCTSMEKVLPISLKLNVTPNTLAVMG